MGVAGFFLASFILWGESDLLDAEGSLDDLLGLGDETVEPVEPVETPKQEAASVIDDLIGHKSLDIRIKTKITLGYTPGFEDGTDTGTFEDSPILEMKNTLILDYVDSDKLRVYQKYSVEAPDFEGELDEMFADYYPADFVNFRAGRFTETWGESKNFRHTNLVAREPDDFSGGTDTLAFRVLFPWKTGSIEALALSREGYWEDEDYPAMDEFGWGLRINPPVPNTDLTAAFYAHREMNTRMTLSLKKTLFGSWETYGEGLMAIDKAIFDGSYDEDEETEDDPYDFALNLGVYRDFFANRLTLGGEYLYNGEESEMTLAAGTWDILYHGHNLALYAKWKQNDWEVYSYGRYNSYEDTGIIGPGVNWYFSDEAKLQAGGGYAWGTDSYDDDYADSNPDDFDRELFFFVQLVINGSWEKTLWPG